MPATESLSVDNFMNEVGTWGSYQHRRFALCCFLCILPSAMVLINVFVIATPAHRCRVPLYDGNITSSKFSLPDSLLTLAIPLQNSSNDNVQKYAQCFMYSEIPHSGLPVQLSPSTISLSPAEMQKKGIEPCTRGYVYDHSVYGRTFTQQHDLVCAYANLAQLPQTLYFIGVLLGSFATGWAADKFGRRPALLVSLLALLVFCAAASASPDLVTFTISRIMVAALEMAVYQVTFVYMVELVSKEKRAFVASVFQLFFPLGEIMAAAVASAQLPWWLYNAVVSAPSIVGLIFVYILMDESVRWLTTVERFDEAEIVLSKIARRNKRPAVEVRLFQQFWEAQKSLHTNQLTRSDDEQPRSNSKLDIFRYPNMRINFCIQASAWFVSSLVFYGLSMNISTLGGNPYVDSILLSLVEIPAYFLEWFGLDRFGRRFMIVMALFVAGIANVLIAVVPYEDKWNWLIVVLALVGKLFIAVSFAIVYVHASELFPTYARTFAVGCASVISRLGGMLASEIALLGQVWHAGPFLLFGAGGLIAATVYLALPETAGLTLPETAEDAEKLKRGNHMFPLRNWRMKASDNNNSRPNISSNKQG